MGEVEPESPSGYLTLIPLNDSRLKPRRTALLVILLLVFALSAATATFFLVPRGVTLGEIMVHSERMAWNISGGSYALNLKAQIPIYNPNYLAVRVDGTMSMFFYDIEAGTKILNSTKIPPRSNPHMLDAVVDASNLPTEYVLTILTQCSSFPRKLIFFLRGNFSIRYLTQTTLMSPTDTYFIIDCLNGGRIVPTPGSPPNSPTNSLAISKPDW